MDRKSGQSQYVFQIVIKDSFELAAVAASLVAEVPTGDLPARDVLVRSRQPKDLRFQRGERAALQTTLPDAASWMKQVDVRWICKWRCLPITNVAILQQRQVKCLAVERDNRRESAQELRQHQKKCNVVAWRSQKELLHRKVITVKIVAYYQTHGGTGSNP